MIEVKNITKAYPVANGTVTALHDISFSVASGEFVSVIGPSGCGKSTLIKIIGDIIEPTKGLVTIDGLTAKEARLRGMFSFVFQNPILLPWRNVIDNVRLPLEILHREARGASHLLQLVGLAGFEDRYPKELSGGMQQRVALARALTFDPQILLMDEPFGAADELTRQVLNQELLRIWREIRVTVFFITHSIDEAVFLANRVLLLGPRPAQLKHILEVPFSQPRDVSLKESQQFQEMVRWLRDQLG